MNDPALKIKFYEFLQAALGQDGFEFRVSKDAWTRRHGGQTDVFQLVCLDAETGYRIQPNVGVRTERVEIIFHKTSGFESEYQNGTCTMGTSIGQLVGGKNRACEFRLTAESEIPSVAEKILSIFHEFALPYYARWSSLHAIDTELNNEPKASSVHRAMRWFHCSTGLIVARLTGRKDYLQLADLYTEMMKTDNKGFYFKRFQALVKSLQEIKLE